MIVVSDTSVISYLIQINRIELLSAVYAEVFIPESVANELNKHPLSKNYLEQKPDWIKVRKVESSELVSDLKRILDNGEAEAIVLALTIHSQEILIDERCGRDIAKQFGLKTRGLLGLLLLAKKNGLIESLRNDVELLRESGFWVSDKVVEFILQEANEL